MTSLTGIDIYTHFIFRGENKMTSKVMHTVVCGTSIWKTPCIKPILILIAIGLVNTVYFIFYLKMLCGSNPASCDFMNYKIFEAGPCCSMWPLSHFIAYMILGYFFPNCWLVMFIFGLLWEMFEFGMGLMSVKHKKQKGIEYSEKWWAPNLYDIVFNGTGMMIGIGIRKLTQKNSNTIKKPRNAKTSTIN